MKIRQLLVPSAAAACILGASAAVADTIHCSVKEPFNTYYIAPTIDLVVDDFGRVKVTDAIIASTDRTSAFGGVEVDNARRLTLIWKVDDVQADPNEFKYPWPVTLQMHLTVQKASGDATLTARSIRTNLQFRAEGNCQVTR